jgi:chromosome partitioning protein
MPVIAFANLKGGVGKSTLAVSVAGALGKGVALIDADPQGTVTAWAAQGALPFPVETAPLQGNDVQGWISRALAVDAQFLIVDLPPMLGDATSAALAIADLACIPVSPSGADITATSSAIDLVQRARQAREGDKPRALLIPSKVDRRTAAGAEIEAVLHDFGEPVAPVVSQRIAHVDAFTAGQWVGDYAPGSAANMEVKALASVIKRLASRS